MRTKDIQTTTPFKNLFKINNNVYQEVLLDIKENGYDQNEPVIVWKEKNILIDGHTRLKAAIELKLREIPVSLLTFKDENDAIQYGIKRNAQRRSVTMGDKFRCFQIVDERIKSGGDRRSKDFQNNKSSNLKDASHIKTAKIIGVSPAQVQKMRTIIDYGELADIDLMEIQENILSIDAAYKVADAKKKEIEKETKADSSFNRTNDNIEWALWTWNPVTGCKHNCKYCYAKDIANRFFKEKFEPTFHEKRLLAPENTNIPKDDYVGEHNVFVCSMADLFGKWVPNEWIEKVFAAIEKSPKWWNYILLTKNPERYLKLSFPNRCWIGATGDTQNRVTTALSVFKQMKSKGVKNKLFLSCEPLMEKIDLGKSPAIDWLIIGGRSRSSGMSEGQPEWEWVERLEITCINEKIARYWKPNLTVRPKQYPKN